MMEYVYVHICDNLKRLLYCIIKLISVNYETVIRY